MATSLSPLSSNFLSPNFTYPTSSSSVLYFLSAKISRASITRISCSNQTSQLDTQKVNPTKKKRKPRPSFTEQVLEKWSVKKTSLRQKFPWEEENEEQESNLIVENEGKMQDFSGVAVTESRIDKNSSVSDSVSFGSGNGVKFAPWVQKIKPNKQERTPIQEEEEEESPDFSGYVPELRIGKNSLVTDSESFGSGNRARFAPWVQEIKPKKPNFDSSAKISQNDGERGKMNNEFFGNREVTVSTSFANKSKKFVRKANFDVNVEAKVVRNDAIQNVEKQDERTSFNEEIHSFGDSDDEFESMRLPWESESGVENVDGSKKSNTVMAEKLVPDIELKRLRNVALSMVERIKVGKAGITQALVDSINEKWRVDELVKLKFTGPSATNMKRIHETLENRTGGLVIWRSGSSVVLFRGMTYKLHCVQSFARQNEFSIKIPQSSKDSGTNFIRRVGQNEAASSSQSSINYSGRYSEELSEEELVNLCELNLLLDGLGPRFKDWPGRDPLPVDADLLPSVVPGYKCPFRLLPYGVKPGLRDREMTFYRRTVRTMPPHFALGRNRGLQGLAAAMVKLWERIAIAKIAIKRGVNNTCNERMAEELKVWTGGTLLSRNKDYIVFYRGNDFLPPDVTKTLAEVEELTALQQEVEDQARQKASTLVDHNLKAATGPLVAGTLAETMAATSRWGSEPSSQEREKMMRESAVARHASLVRFLEQKLGLARGKVKRAEKALLKVQNHLEPAELPTDLETLTDEERFLFRKMGLSMKPFLLLGRRGIFDGTIENMHLHWKYRELVKIIVEGKRFAQVKHVAVSLEAESGGVLVSVDKTTKGHAVIVYRGKNYQRPRAIKPKNLLTRRQALARSIELQRREALKHHISELQERIEKLKSELDEMKTIKEIDEETLHSRVDVDSDGDDHGDVEEDDDEAYLETYDSGDEDGYP